MEMEICHGKKDHMSHLTKDFPLPGRLFRLSSMRVLARYDRSLRSEETPKKMEKPSHQG